jgi:pSer/pThr/pTyr-binding forkhead associated (FHA) protein
LLVATAGPSRGRTYPIPSNGATIGRLADNAVCLPDERLSREHARIEFHDGHFWLRDLDSTNGTALNGSPVSSAQIISNGDTVELGSNTLVVTIDST